MNEIANDGIQQHNERAASIWSAGGKDYNEISRGIADSIEHCVTRLNPLPSERILDLSTGTGWTSRVVARRGARVVGVDIASDLLDAAKAIAKAENLPIAYQLGDAENLPFEDGEFDGVVSTCGIMFASRPEAAARELARVWRKGGRIALTTWLADSNLFKMFEVMKRYMPPPPSPAPPSPFEWGASSAFESCLAARLSFYSRKACLTIASQAGMQRGTPSQKVMDRRGLLQRTSILSGSDRSAMTSALSIRASPRSLVSAYLASTG